VEAILSGTSTRYSRDQGEFDRAIGFVDATYALALTLLVTTINVDHPSVAFSSLGALNDAIGQQFVAFANRLRGDYQEEQSRAAGRKSPT
jgi:hypothetical protein